MDKDILENLFEVEFIDAGDNWKGKCPFHDENTPSFYIHKTNYLCNCFGCGISGYTHTLLAKKRQISEVDARSLLGVTWEDVPREKVYKGPKYFPESWLSGWKRIRQHRYLTERGFRQETTQKFEARFDKATQRIAFPLREFRSRKLVGAAGRSINGSDPKWVFYWKCNKSMNLFIPRHEVFETIVVVEGIFDVMWLWQHGIPAAAILGSKPSWDQIIQLKVSADNFIIALDNDEAGQSGAAILERQLKRSGVVKHVMFPSFANDVCELNKEQLHELLTKSITPLEKKLSVIS